MEISYKDGIYHLSGRLDEFAEFAELFEAASPLKLNLGKISSINSIGVRKFLAFALDWSPRRFELSECTPEFISNVNVIPQMLGKLGDASQVRSFYVPYSCEPCKKVENVLYDCATLRLDAHGDIQTVERFCSKCGDPMELDVEKTEYFTFLADLAIPAAS